MALSKVGKNQVDQSASLTVDGDLTVDTNTLYVDSTNDRVSIGTSSAESLPLTVAGSQSAIALVDTDRVNNTYYSAVWGDQVANLHLVADYQGTSGSSFISMRVGGTALANEKVRVDSSGRVTMPYQPSFGVYTTTGQTVGSTIQFNGTSFNTGNHFNTSTGIFTAPVAGRYWFYWHLLTDRTTNSGEGYVDLFKNNVYHYRNYEPKESTLNQHQEFKGGLIVDMATNDTVNLVYTAAVSGNIVGSLQHCTFSGFLIG